MTAVALILCVAIAFEALILYAGQLQRRDREERAYWAATRERPELYDWSQELDL